MSELPPAGTLPPRVPPQGNASADFVDLTDQLKEEDQKKSDFSERVLNQADAFVKKTAESKFARSLEAFADGAFRKLGLNPTDSFLCIAPKHCGLRMVVFVLTILQACYGLSLLLTSIFSSLFGFFGAIFNFNLGAIFAFIFSFLGQLISGGFYLVAGFFGIRSTYSSEKVLAVSSSPEVAEQTKFFTALNYLAFCAGTTMSIVVAICNSFGLNVFLAIFYWIWVLFFVAIAAYFLFIVWSYKCWVVAASTEGPAGTSIGRVVKGAGTPPPGQPIPSAGASYPAQLPVSTGV